MHDSMCGVCEVGISSERGVTSKLFLSSKGARTGFCKRKRRLGSKTKIFFPRVIPVVRVRRWQKNIIFPAVSGCSTSLAKFVTYFQKLSFLFCCTHRRDFNISYVNKFYSALPSCVALVYSNSIPSRRYNCCSQ